MTDRYCVRSYKELRIPRAFAALGLCGGCSPMARYTDDSKERVREAVDFVELVSARTELRRAGSNRYEGLCPFHDERTPSFGIEPVQKVYYCFGCQASGDLFTFVQETEGLDFREALELLADRYNVELEREAEEPGEAEPRRAASGCSSCCPAPRTSTSATYGSPRRPAAPATTCAGGARRGDPARLPGRLFAERLGPRCCADQSAAASPPSELYATGLAQRSQQTGAFVRPLQGAASCFR